jgi:hypothetical protein
MTGIDPPRGPASPGGPAGVSGTDRPGEAPAATGPAPAIATSASSGSAPNDEVARLAQEIDSGRSAPSDAIAQLVETTLHGLDPADQTELRLLFGELLASDPYLADLIQDLGRDLGTAPPDPDM